MEALRVILDVRELVGQPQLLMHLQVRDLAPSRGWTEGLSIQNSLSNSQSIFSLPFYESLSSSLPPLQSLSSSFSHSLASLLCFLFLFISPSLHLSFPQCMFPSLPVALHRKFNIGLFGVSKDSFHWSSGLRTKTNISCRGQEQQTQSHYLATLVLPLRWTLFLFLLVPSFFPGDTHLPLTFLASSQAWSAQNCKTQVLHLLEFSGQHI